MNWQTWSEALSKAIPRSRMEGADSWAPFARWALPEEINSPAWSWKQGDSSILLGRHDNNLVGRADDDRHIITVAGTRAGKGRSLILPNLAYWPGSAVIIDPKGELARKTAQYRAKGLGQDVYVIDPWGVSGWKSAQYDPLRDLDDTHDNFIDDVALVADALIIDAERDTFWTDSAKNLVRRLILYMFAEGGAPSLPRLRRVLLGAEGRFIVPESGESLGSPSLFARMATMNDYDGMLSLIGQSFLEKHPRELSSVISTAREQLSFLDSPKLQSSLAPSKLTLSSVRQKPTTVYLCIPAARLATHARWLRVILNVALARLEQESPIKTLLLLEEFAVLGRMDAIEKAAGQIAGYGVKLWVVLQDVGQLKAIYKDRWETFLGNAGITTWFGLNDLTSLKYVSERLGDTHFIRLEKIDRTMTQVRDGAAEYREQVVQTKLLSPEETGRLFARETSRLLILHPGSRPLILRRLDASDQMFRGRIDGEQGS